MENKIIIHAHGHKNILALHKSTIEITKETSLTPAGDCIVAVGADMGFCDFDEKFKENLRNSVILVTIACKGVSWSVKGHGTPGLEMTHCEQMVIRTSRYECPRTLMVDADIASIDMPREMVELLQDPSTDVIVTIDVIGPQDNTPLHQNTRT